MSYETDSQGPYNGYPGRGEYRPSNLPTYLPLEDITRVTAATGTGSIVDRTVAVLSVNSWRAPIERGE